jgi:CubicO group peptidase (beta-lactamase class C family)
MPGGFTADGLAALDAALAGHVVPGQGANTVPGLVALVARGGQVHVTTAGHKALGDGEPIGRDAIFRIASLTKPIVGAAAMLLIEDGAMALDDPVHRWLPELSDRRVLRRFDAELTDTVPAARAITVEDALSFRLGFGCVFAPGPLPIAQAEASLGLNTLGPPWPPTPLTPDEWIAGLGRLPLIDQPGEVWRYNTGATVAGILVERVAGAPLAEVLSKRVFEPLGMVDAARPDDGAGPRGEPVVLRRARWMGADDVGSGRIGSDGPDRGGGGRHAARLRLGRRQRHHLAHRPHDGPHRHPAHPADGNVTGAAAAHDGLLVRRVRRDRGVAVRPVSRARPAPASGHRLISPLPRHHLISPRIHHRPISPRPRHHLISPPPRHRPISPRPATATTA